LTSRLISSGGLAKFISKHTARPVARREIQVLIVVGRIQRPDRLDFHQHGIFH